MLVNTKKLFGKLFEAAYDWNHFSVGLSFLWGILYCVISFFNNPVLFSTTWVTHKDTQTHRCPGLFRAGNSPVFGRRMSMCLHLEDISCYVLVFSAYWTLETDVAACLISLKFESAYKRNSQGLVVIVVYQSVSFARKGSTESLLKSIALWTLDVKFSFQHVCTFYFTEHNDSNRTCLRL